MRLNLILVGLLFTYCTNAIGQIVTDSTDRTWTDKTGKFTVTASLVELHSDSISLTRADDQSLIKIPLAKLSPNDAKFVLGVRKEIEKRESLIASAKSLTAFRDKADSFIDSYNEVPPAGETSVQAQTRKATILAKLKAATTGEGFTLFLEVADVRQGKIYYDPLDQMSFGFQSAEVKAKRKAFEASVFDITIKPKDYPASLPKTFRVVAEPAGTLKVGDYFCLACRRGDFKTKIGEFVLEHREFKFGCSIIDFTVPPRDVIEPILAAISNQTPKANKPKWVTADITREDFRREFFKLAGADSRGISMISRESLTETFGPASKQANISSREYLAYQCSDGIVLLKFATNVDAVVPEGHVLVLSVDDY